MNIALKPEQAQFVQQTIDAGRYQSADEVISEALQLLERRDREYLEWQEQAREKVNVAIEELESGQGLDGETVVVQLRKKLRQRRL